MSQEGRLSQERGSGAAERKGSRRTGEGAWRSATLHSRQDNHLLHTDEEAAGKRGRAGAERVVRRDAG